MSDNDNPSHGLLAMLLVINTIFTVAISRYMAGNMWKDMAVQHHAGRYNPTTGAFEWLDEVKEQPGLTPKP